MALVKIGKAAQMLGVKVQTLRAWEASGELIPDRRSKGGVRYYDVARVMDLGKPRSGLVRQLDQIIADLQQMRDQLAGHAARQSQVDAAGA